MNKQELKEKYRESITNLIKALRNFENVINEDLNDTTENLSIWGNTQIFNYLNEIVVKEKKVDYPFEKSLDEQLYEFNNYLLELEQVVIEILD